jgi:predicted GNAT family acetyltransferase
MSEPSGIFTDNAARYRFEWSERGETAFAAYRSEAGGLAITHVEAPVALRGTGAAGRLMKALIAHARAKGLKLIARCPYAAVWLKRHREAGDVLSAPA